MMHGGRRCPCRLPCAGFGKPRGGAASQSTALQPTAVADELNVPLQSTFAALAETFQKPIDFRSGSRGINLSNRGVNLSSIYSSSLHMQATGGASTAVQLDIVNDKNYAGVSTHATYMETKQVHHTMLHAHPSSSNTYDQRVMGVKSKACVCRPQCMIRSWSPSTNRIKCLNSRSPM